MRKGRWRSLTRWVADCTGGTASTLAGPSVLRSNPVIATSGHRLQWGFWGDIQEPVATTYVCLHLNPFSPTTPVTPWRPLKDLTSAKADSAQPCRFKIVFPNRICIPSSKIYSSCAPKLFDHQRSIYHLRPGLQDGRFYRRLYEMNSSRGVIPELITW